MDLTKSYPRSVREKMLGIVQLARTIDKGKAVVDGNVGEYNYDCPMDKHLFEYLGLDGEKLLAAIKNAKNDAEIEAYVKPFVAKKSAAELERWNEEWLRHAPDAGTPAHDYFVKLRNEVAPDRTDVTAWTDLLDLDEKRSVPHRAVA
ncbi:MAG TPA: DUF5069 domain-containing protein [Candidatus Binatia bacterium]|nr:DUF5069 domain-containing protein [Candidatus Binatia bacterium]